MSFFRKKHLKNRYRWDTEPDQNEVTRYKDPVFFNRRQGFEVLCMVNDFLDDKKLSSIKSFHKAETLIAKKLPGNIRSWKKVKCWLLNNWDK